jgi:hypothetical protein
MITLDKYWNQIEREKRILISKLLINLWLMQTLSGMQPLRFSLIHKRFFKIR